jgi:hypothetical protein
MTVLIDAMALIEALHRPVVAVFVSPGSSAAKEFEICVAAAATEKEKAKTDATIGRAIEAELDECARALVEARDRKAVTR